MQPERLRELIEQLKLRREAIILGTLHRLRKEYPQKRFYPPADHCVCPAMKMTTLERVAEALQQMQHVVTFPREVQTRARQALDRMLAAA